MQLSPNEAMELKAAISGRLNGLDKLFKKCVDSSQMDASEAVARSISTCKALWQRIVDDSQ
jgi:hypothetical protein